MNVALKLRVHLEHIVMPLGVPLNANQVNALCDQADEAQRRAAVDRARVHVPFLLPEETQAEMWVRKGK